MQAMSFDICGWCVLTFAVKIDIVTFAGDVLWHLQLIRFWHLQLTCYDICGNYDICGWRVMTFAGIMTFAVDVLWHLRELWHLRLTCYDICGNFDICGWRVMTFAGILTLVGDFDICGLYRPSSPSPSPTICCCLSIRTARCRTRRPGSSPHASFVSIEINLGFLGELSSYGINIFIFLGHWPPQTHWFWGRVINLLLRTSFVSIISEFSHMFGQALAQWRAFSLAVARSSRLHSFREVGISVGAAWSALRSRIHRLYLLYQHSPIYSCWFCCGPYPCGVCWGISTASTQI